MGKRGPPARVVPDWIWEYVELHTVGQSQPVKIALINKLLIQIGEVPIKRSFYQDHVARRKAARCLALVGVTDSDPTRPRGRRECEAVEAPLEQGGSQLTAVPGGHRGQSPPALAACAAGPPRTARSPGTRPLSRNGHRHRRLAR